MEEKLKYFIEQLWQSLLSCIKIALKSNTHTPTISVESTDLVILANGPSLNKTLSEHADFLKGKMWMAVNHAVESDRFEEIKPPLYLLADPLFWIVPEFKEQVFGAMARKTTWPMTLFMPTRAYKYKDLEWQRILATNPNIQVMRFNTTPIEGFTWFANRIYRSGLGMPRPHNVLVASIATALRMPFKRIYLAGADHSWLPEIKVTEQNEVLMNQKHFYDHATSQAETVTQEDLKPARLYTILHHMSVTYKSYFILRDFARFQHKEVINITPGSFIDAFPRQQL
ncbi:MAG: hypothetical protein KBH23_01530 [Bacteroidaceae bacterium]|nr:hypothetical protein [Bacteroidaceae bacterium]MBP9636759.1 hypothetical protein [Bacteroidaceae bacterium]